MTYRILYRNINSGEKFTMTARSESEKDYCLCRIGQSKRDEIVSIRGIRHKG